MCGMPDVLCVVLDGEPQSQKPSRPQGPTARSQRPVSYKWWRQVCALDGRGQSMLSHPEPRYLVESLHRNIITL